MIEKPVIDPATGAAPADTEVSADEYTKGNPKRGALRAFVIVLAVLAVGALFFTSDKAPKKQEIDANVTRPESKASDDISKQLKVDANVPLAAPPPVVMPVRPAQAVALGSEDGTPKMTQAELDQLRREKAAASGMDATEVVIGMQQQFSNGPVAEDPAAREAAALRKLTEDAIARSFPKEDSTPKGRKMGQDESFLSSNGAQPLENPTLVQPSKGDHEIAPGTIIRLALLRGINTDSPGQITAQVVSNVYDSITGRRLLIPKGSRVIGVYSSEFAVGQRRVVMAMTRLDLPNGMRVSLSGSPAADSQGYSGLPGDVNNHYFSMFSGALMVGAVSLLLPKDQQAVTSTLTASGTQSGGTILANALSSVVQVLADRNKITKPTATIEPGEVFSFSTTKEILMMEYK